MLRTGFVVTLLFATFLAGCASRSLTAHQCVAGDWYSVGYRDASNGLSRSQLLTHQNACGRHGIVPDTKTYQQGWAEGINSYCTEQRGYDLGVGGGKLRSVCPEHLSVAYRQAYTDGRELYLARRQVSQLENTIHNRRARIEAIGDELLATAAAQVDPLLTTSERLDLLQQTKKLMDERDRLSASLPQLTVDLDRAIAHLDGLERAIAGL